jgi:hypothetical protein
MEFIVANGLHPIFWWLCHFHRVAPFFSNGLHPPLSDTALLGLFFNFTKFPANILPPY